MRQTLRTSPSFPGMTTKRAARQQTRKPHSSQGAAGGPGERCRPRGTKGRPGPFPGLTPGLSSPGTRQLRGKSVLSAAAQP